MLHGVITGAGFLNFWSEIKMKGKHVSYTEDL